MIPSVFIAQRDYPVGALARNRCAILAAAQQAQKKDACAALTPELALTGYCPDDMLFDSSFMDAVEREFEILAAEVPPLPLIVGLPWREDGKLYGAAALLQNGRVEFVYKKTRLPNESVFDERRYFTAGNESPPCFESGGVKFAVQICADVWDVSQGARVAECGADFVLSPNASPFHLGKHAERLRAARAFVAAARAGLFYCNSVGGQDELVFDGASFFMDKDGAVQRQSPAFAADDGGDNIAQYPDDDEAAYSALVTGLRDYAAAAGFRGAVFGLSGGIDSALTAAIAADALGAKNLLAVMMPSPHTSAASLQDAAAIASNLGLELLTIPINPLMESFAAALSPHLQTRDGDITHENIQARLRGMLLMALSNNRGLLTLATGNKSELACGYATLYGDMCGGFAPLKDVVKTRVWTLSRYHNRRGEVIPARVISRAPSAELRDNQTDQQTLPPYETIDAAIAAHVENGAPFGEWTRAAGAQTARQFLTLLAAGEHKRRQGAPGPKITSRAFGRDWRMPIANRFRYPLQNESPNAANENNADNAD